MAIHTSQITPEESMKEQLATFIMEKETNFADSSRVAVVRFTPHIKEKKVVDLGCGDGASTEHFQANGIEVVGVDINQSKLDKNPTKTILTDMISYLKKHKNIPNIFIHHSLEHLPNPQEVIDLISNKLKPGGLVYIEVPANDHIHSVHHATFDTPKDLLPKGFEIVEEGTNKEEHYLIARRYNG